MAFSPAPGPNTPAPRYAVPVKGATPGQAAKQAAVKLAPGQTLAYQPGKGYYAKSPATGYPDSYVQGSAGRGSVYAPKITSTRPGKTAAHPGGGGNVPPPVDPYAALTQAQVDARAATLAQGQLTPQQTEIRRQQALAATQATADETALGEYAKAASGIEGGMAGHLADAYHTAVTDQGNLGTGLAGQVGADLQHAQEGNDAFAQAVGQAGAAHGTNPQDVQNTLGMLHSVIPGDQLATQGLANVSQAYRAPQISLAAGAEQIQARMAQAHTEGDTYAQKLLDLAATYPDLKAKALDQLNQYELDKAKYRDQVANNSLANARADRALADNEALAGLRKNADIAKLNREFTYKYAALRLRSKEDAAKLAAAVQAGKHIDTAASRLLGHIVYKDNTQDPSLKVAQSTGANSASGKAAVAKIKAQGTAVSLAISLRGKPTLAGKAGDTLASLAGHGKFVADPRYPRAKIDPKTNKMLPNQPPNAVFPDGTTMDEKRALYSGGHSYEDAQRLIFEKIGGQTFLDQYHVKKATVMNWIATAMKDWRR